MHFAGLLALIAVQAALVPKGEGFKILALIPYKWKSHFYIFRPLLEELAKRGNDVTVLSHFPRKSPLENYHDISLVKRKPDTLSSQNDIGSGAPDAVSQPILKLGVEAVCRKGLQQANVQKLINSEEKYDLLITEIFSTDCFLGFAYKFQAPFIAVHTAPMSPWIPDRIANPDNPAYVPNSLRGHVSRMNFWDRFDNVLSVLYNKILYHHDNDWACTKIARQHFGEDMPPVHEIAKNVSMILVNTHFVHQIARPLVPGVKEIAGIHIGEKKKLPQDLEEWISGARYGVVYLSMGTNIKVGIMPKAKKMIFLRVLAALPQRVLMKWEELDQSSLPKNVKISGWLPQYDILCHPNVKAFIGHGGMLGITEAVYAGKPMIVFPAFGDQFTNGALLQEKGFAIVLKFQTINEKTLRLALHKVLHNASYRETAKKMSAAIRDRLVPPLEEAAYWVEYVARHKGAPLLRSPAHGMPLCQYLLLDVIGVIVFALLLTTFIVKIIMRKLFGRKGKRSKRTTIKTAVKKRN